jgi:hypothetical protein
MKLRISPRPAKLAAAMLLATGAAAMSAGAADASEVVYNNIPSPLPGNFASFGNEAYSLSEFGGLIELAGAARKNPKVTVAMSSWACQSGGVYQDTCETPKPNRKFKWPITLNLYDVGPGNTVGAKIGSVTRTFSLPYRPSKNDAVCVAKGYEAGTWYDAATNHCYHGMAFAISFKPVHVELRQQVIVTVSYNTTDHGPSPVGSAACSSTSGGCYYDSLNVAITEPSEGTLSLGSQPTKALYLSSTWAAMYCGSSTPLGSFGPTAPIEGACASGSPYETEEGIQPAISVSAR